MTYETFAQQTYSQTHSQGEVVNALLNEFIELPEDEAESIAINAVENYIAEKQFAGEAHSDEQRGN